MAIEITETHNWGCCCCSEWRCAHPQSVKEMCEDTIRVRKLKTEQFTR